MIRAIYMFFTFVLVLVLFLDTSKNDEVLIRHHRQAGGRKLPGSGKLKAKGHCVMRINEVNTDSNQDEPSLFIELKMLCVAGRKKRRATVKSMNGYYIVILRANPPAVTFFANLAHHQLNNDRLFTIGDKAVPNVDMLFSHESVKSIYKNRGVAQSLPQGDESPYAILLFDTGIAAKMSNFKLFEKPDGDFLERIITPDDIQYILNVEKQLEEEDISFLLDMVVYGRKAHVTSCSLFDALWRDVEPVETGKRYLLRDWDTTQQIKIGNQMVSVKDYSLNRCTPSSTAFCPTCFQYDVPSPGTPNPCKGAAFFIEDVAQNVSKVDLVTVDPIPHCSADHPDVPESRYPLIQEAKFAETRENLIEKRRLGNEIDCGDEVMDIAINYGTLQERQSEPIRSSALSDISGSSWSDDWVDVAQNFVPGMGMIFTDPEITTWLRVKVPGAITPVAFYCAACVAFFKDEMGNVIKKKAIMTPNGYFHHDTRKNAHEIREHMNSDVLKSAMHYQYQLKKVSTEVERTAWKHSFENAYDERLVPTARMVRTVFAEIIAETPFMYHEIFVNLQKVNGVNLGTHQYHALAASDITLAISSKMHSVLLNHLIEKSSPFSLIVDTSTTSRNVPLLIVYIQTLEDGYPVTYYYRSIDLPRGESADATFKRFWDTILLDDTEYPGFKEYFIKNIAFFVSDSASVMVGIRNSFYTLLRAKTPSQKLGQISCMAHKMALVVKAAVRATTDPQFDYIKRFEKGINDFYMFYTSRGSKRFQHLADTAEKYGLKVFRLRKNIEVRWSTAEYEVIHNIIKDWDVLEKDLLDIQTDHSNFNVFAREQATKLYDTLTNVGNLVLFYEFLDFLAVNALISRALQSRASILADHVNLISEGFTKYMLMIDMPGEKLDNFLKQVECPGVCTKPLCNLMQVEECDKPEYRDISLRANENFKMYQVRENFYRNLFDAMSNYFDYDRLESMKIFDHRLQYSIPDMVDFVTKFESVCSTFPIENLEDPNINCESLSRKVYDFITIVMQKTLYKGSFGNPSALPPSQFWPFVLQNTDRSVEIHADVYTFFSFLLIQSDSSAEAERGFSFVNRISEDARSNLKPTSIDALVRVKLNANKPVEDIKAFMYAREYEKKHYLVDAAKIGGNPKVRTVSAYNERVSRLF